MLDRSWFERDAPIVAPDLLNKLLVTTITTISTATTATTATTASDEPTRNQTTSRTSGRIVEVEAYMPDDPASHTFRGPTRRNGVMFGPAGYLYVYLSYGIHHCVNVVTGAAGSGQAVLIRAVEPAAGIDVMRIRRNGVAARSIADGPGKLSQALAIGLGHDGVDLLGEDAEISIVDDGCQPPETPLAGPRIGITKGIGTPWRFRVPRPLLDGAG
jgi:DNA-3-methyladenine glycosylase